MYTWNIFDRLM